MGLPVQHTGANTPEVKSLKEGEYVGVRRFTRILERGTESKGKLDTVIDRCGGLVNLRTAIMRYRKPRRWFRFYRSDCLECNIVVRISCDYVWCSMEWSLQADVHGNKDECEHHCDLCPFPDRMARNQSRQ